MITFGSLFAGIGGMDLGLERAGMRCSWQVEIDPFARRVLARHWPDVPRFEDVRTVGAAQLASVDLICGGFPCQDISNAGKRAGIGGARSGLWSEYARIVRELRPRFVLVENVAALLARGLGRVLGDLAACGYDAEWDCIPAAAVGAPHRRDRLFIVAHTQRHALRQQPESEPGCGDPAITGDDRADVADADLAGPEGRWVPGAVTECVADVAHAASARRSSGPSRQGRSAWDEARRQGPERLGGAMADADRGRQQIGAELDGASAPNSADRNPRRRHPDGRGNEVADAARCGLEGVGIFGVDARRTLPVSEPWWASEPDVGRVAHGVPARVDRLRTLGNAVVPQVAEWIGRRIVDAAR